MNPLADYILSRQWENKSFYCQYLAQSYHYVFHSTRLLALSAAHTTKEQQQFYKRCIKHISEEAGHELIAIRDLANLGEKIEDYPELETTRALWEPQYYKIEKSAPSLLGYILSLEYLTVRTFGQLSKALDGIYGESCGKFVKIHAEEDPDHVEKCLVEIQKLPQNELDIVMKNYSQTCVMFELFLDQCSKKRQLRYHNPSMTNPLAELSM